MKTDTLALFDLDNTLLPIDSDYEWGEFMVRIGAVDKGGYSALLGGYSHCCLHWVTGDATSSLECMGNNFYVGNGHGRCRSVDGHWHDS